MIKFKNRKKVIGINAFLIATLFGLITFNKEIIRPRIGDSVLMNLISGCFPNFIAAYIISLASVSAVLVRKLKYGRLIVYGSSLLVFIFLLVEELQPMWGASTQYDSYDIIASGIGSILAILTFELFTFYKKRNH